eukprot:6137278-Amphidinium_carterae.1
MIWRTPTCPFESPHSAISSSGFSRASAGSLFSSLIAREPSQLRATLVCTQEPFYITLPLSEVICALKPKKKSAADDRDQFQSLLQGLCCAST